MDEGFLQRIQRAGSDVAKDDADGSDGKDRCGLEREMLFARVRHE